MTALVDSISAATGLEPETARKAIGIFLDFVQKAVPAAVSAAVIDPVPGGRMMAAAAAEDEAQGGGTARPGLDGLADRLMAEGVDAADMTVLCRPLLNHLRDEIGAAPVDALLAAVPDLDRMT